MLSFCFWLHLSLMQNHPKLASELKTCPFNARHLVPKSELTHHTATCEDRISLDADDGAFLITTLLCLSTCAHKCFRAELCLRVYRWKHKRTLEKSDSSQHLGEHEHNRGLGRRYY